MDELSIESVNSREESTELDYLLWDVLWKPLGLSRSFRGALELDGESLELVAKADGRVVGGLVANWIDDSEVEIRHIALKPEVQNRGVGRRLVASLVSAVSGQGCRRIQTVARSTSVGFFRKLDFVNSPCRPPEHPDFKRHGITFVLMEKKVEQPRRGGAVNHGCQP